MAMRPYAPSGFTRRVLPVGARRRLAPTSSLPTRALSTDWGHVIPAKAGTQFFPEMDPRFRGGDVLTFISVGGPLAHDHSE
jgi:hypothetical protein